MSTARIEIAKKHRSVEGNAMEVLELAKAFAGPLATIVAAITAVSVTYHFGKQQVRIAEAQAATADGQKRIAAARLNFDLYEKRYAVFDAARRLLLEAVQHDHVDPKKVIEFNIETADAVFLFNQDIVDYLARLRDKILRLKTLKTQEKAADEYGEEEKRQRLVDLVADQHQALNIELALIVQKFTPYLKLGNI
jgi:hypothetical protein